jgi:hypothetical protein
MSKYGRHHNEEERGLKKTTLFLYEGDMEDLQHMYPDVGASRVIRLLVQNHINAIKSKQVVVPHGVDLPIEEIISDERA